MEEFQFQNHANADVDPPKSLSNHQIMPHYCHFDLAEEEVHSATSRPREPGSNNKQLNRESGNNEEKHIQNFQAKKEQNITLTMLVHYQTQIKEESWCQEGHLVIITVIFVITWILD